MSAPVRLAEAAGGAGGAFTMAAAIVGMLAVAFLAWKVVQRQERGDAELESKLRADDERAARGLRGELGLPPDPPSRPE